jgi:hypothetical protein
VRLINLLFAVFGLLIPLSLKVQISQPCKSDETAKILYTFNRDCVWTKFRFQTFSHITQIVTGLAMIVAYVLNVKIM